MAHTVRSKSPHPFILTDSSNCRLPREPTVQSRSALGDPGDWYCDYCGLCSEPLGVLS